MPVDEASRWAPLQALHTAGADSVEWHTLEEELMNATYSIWLFGRYQVGLYRNIPVIPCKQF